MTKKLLLIICALLAFTACEKEDLNDEQKLAQCYELIEKREELNLKIKSIEEELKTAPRESRKTLMTQLMEVVKERNALSRKIIKLKDELGIDETSELTVNVKEVHPLPSIRQW